MRLNEEMLKRLPILLGAALLPTLACAALEQIFLYFPDRELVTMPATMRLEYEDVFFSAADGTQLHGWYLPGEDGTYSDMRGALSWLKDRGWRAERMIYFGRSVGAGVLKTAVGHDR